MSDVSCALLNIVRLLELDLNRDGPSYVRAAAVCVDKPGLVAAACYSQWISDHLHCLIADWRKRDLRAAEGVAVARGEPGAAAMYWLELDNVEQPVVFPDLHEPPFPAALREIHRSRVIDNIQEKFDALDGHRRAGRLDLFGEVDAEIGEHLRGRDLNRVQETLAEAAAAMERNKTKRAEDLHGHITALAAWAKGEPPHGHTMPV
jgi:hypothetical protein